MNEEYFFEPVMRIGSELHLQTLFRAHVWLKTPSEADDFTLTGKQKRKSRRYRPGVVVVLRKEIPASEFGRLLQPGLSLTASSSARADSAGYAGGTVYFIV